MPSGAQVKIWIQTMKDLDLWMRWMLMAQILCKKVTILGWSISTKLEYAVGRTRRVLYQNMMAFRCIKTES